MSEFFAGFNWKSLGIDAGVIVGIVAICEGLKRKVFAKGKNQSKQVLLADLLLSGIAAASLTVPFMLQPFGANWLRYAGISTLLYIFAKPVLKNIGIKE